MGAAEEKFIKSGKLRLWTERFGDRRDPVVLLVMGTSTSGLGWPDDLVDTLVAGGRQVIRFDHRDTGRSDCVDFTTDPYTLADLAADSLAVLDAYDTPSAHVAGASLGGAVGQWLAAHRPERVTTLTAIMASPMGTDAGPIWVRAMSGQAPDPDDLPPPAPGFLEHLMRAAAVPRTTREENVAANMETWRVLNGEVLPFDEAAARRLVEESYDRAGNPAAATNHDLAGRAMTADRRAPLSSIKAPTLVIHGTADPLLPTPHGAALAARIPGARLETIEGMGHSFLSPGLPRRVAELILRHTAQ
ncbi:MULTISPECIES: alpha/beta fold hydrolase [unclassified Nonomuraea]|uniref:alpha/beta fold hydrolase n=1 Tax=unclassified Nonomuraea TaxID=2593643 RepID=UPI0035C09D32